MAARNPSEVEPGKPRRLLGRLLVRVPAVLQLGTFVLAGVLLLTPVRVPLGDGGAFGIERVDVGEIPGSGPRPGWYAGPLFTTGSEEAIGSYSAGFGRDWALLLQFAEPGYRPEHRWRRPTRFISEHPLTRMLVRRVSSGRMTAKRLEQLLGPPTHRTGAGASEREWTYQYPDWNGGFLFKIDRRGRVVHLGFGHG